MIHKSTFKIFHEKFLFMTTINLISSDILMNLEGSWITILVIHLNNENDDIYPVYKKDNFLRVVKFRIVYEVILCNVKFRIICHSFKFK